MVAFNTLRQRQNGRHFADAIFKWIFFNENVWIPIKISLKLVPQGPINNIPALVQIMAWRRPGDKPLSGPMMVRLATHICVTRPQWVNTLRPAKNGAISRTEFSNALFWMKIFVYIFLKFVPKTDDMAALIQVMAWCQAGEKPSPEPMMAQFADISSTRLKCVNSLRLSDTYMHQ